jgi:hypothetical protein
LGPSILNITEMPFVSIADTRRLLDEGDRRRHFGITNMNAHSSRSHVIFRLNIEARKVFSQPAKPLRQSWGKDKPNCFSTLNLVDLAGSERSNKAGTSGQSLKEGSYINKSLLTLGTVIANLSEDKPAAHIPYRNSKLTRLLASALGGNAKTCMVACISPARSNAHESLSTLRFASRAKRVVNHVRKNIFDDARTLAELLAKQKNELDTLKDELERVKLNGLMDGPMKEKAIAATKRLKGIRLVSINASQLIRALGREGKHALAATVRSNVRSVIQGSKDILQVMDEHREIMLNHFSNNPAMLLAIASFEKVIDGDVLDNDFDDDGATAIDSVFLGGGDDGELNFDLVDEELEQQAEVARMSGEDIRAKSVARIRLLEAEKSENLKVVHDLKRRVEDFAVEIRSKTADLETAHYTETVLKRSLEDIKHQMEELRVETTEKINNLNKSVVELEEASLVSEQTIMDLQSTVASKNADISRLESVCEQLRKDIEQREDEMKAFQSEAAKTRLELRQQMERLRGNMHNMLQQGGETTKVLEMQNAFLHKDCELLRDELDAARNSNKQLTHETISLRNEVQKYTKDFQHYSDDLQKSRAEVRLYLRALFKVGDNSIIYSAALQLSNFQMFRCA